MLSILRGHFGIVIAIKGDMLQERRTWSRPQRQPGCPTEDPGPLPVRIDSLPS
jgi:hypothetical protein